MSDKEILMEFLQMKGITKVRLNEKDLELFYALSEYGILYAEDASRILNESAAGKRRMRLKLFNILDGKRGIVYLGSLGREMLLELNYKPYFVKEEDKVTEKNNNILANRYRNV